MRPDSDWVELHRLATHRSKSPEDGDRNPPPQPGPQGPPPDNGVRIDRIDVGELAGRCSTATFAVIRAVVLLLPGRPTRTVRIFDGLELVLPARGDGGW